MNIHSTRRNHLDNTSEHVFDWEQIGLKCHDVTFCVFVFFFFSIFNLFLFIIRKKNQKIMMKYFEWQYYFVLNAIIMSNMHRVRFNFLYARNGERMSKMNDHRVKMFPINLCYYLLFFFFSIFSRLPPRFSLFEYFPFLFSIIHTPEYHKVIIANLLGSRLSVVLNIYIH